MSVTPSTPSSQVRRLERARKVDRSNLVAALVIGVIAIALGILAGVLNPLLNNSTASGGAEVDRLFGVLLGVGTTVFVIVQGGLLYSIIRFRSTSDSEDGPPHRGNTLLEIVWTAIPAVVVTGLSVFSYATLTSTEAAQPDALVVQVTARQFAWDFYYPHRDVHSGDLHVPRGRQVLLQIVSKDVIHAFWVPDFRIKKDAMPDRVTEIRFTADQDGTYPIVCSRICGVGHAGMRSDVVVHEPNDYEAWIGQQAGASAVAAQTNTPDAAARQLFLETGCNACHTLAAAQATGKAGPALDHIGSEAADRIKDPNYKGQAKTPEDFIRESLVNPNAYVVPGFQPGIMPQDFGKRLTDQQIDTLVQYLVGQK